MKSILHKPLSCPLFAFLFTLTAGVAAAWYRAVSALALALNLLTSMVCHWCVLAMWRHSTLAKNSRTNWDKAGQSGPEISCKFQLISKSPILPCSNRGKAASQFFMSLKVFARRFRENLKPICYHHISRYSYSQGKPMISSCHIGTPVLSKLSQSPLAYLQ